MLGIMLRFAALLITFAIFDSGTLLADLGREAGTVLVHSYSPAEYAANQQSWALVRDTRGVMFIANNDGVLEFDGVSWRKIPIAGQFVRSLAIDSRGTVFVGGRGTFGYLSPGPAAQLQFVSLLDKVSVKDREFNDIFDLLPTADGVYFVSHDRVFLYTPSGEMKVFQPKHRFGRGFAFHGEFFVTEEDTGLLQLQGSDLVPADIAADKQLLHGSPLFASGNVPLIAYDRKLYRFSLRSIDRFPTAADSYFQLHDIYCVNQLPGGDIAVGTKSGGLVLLRQSGEVERIIEKTDGLPSDFVTAIFGDAKGQVWVTTDNGIAHFPLHITQFSEAQGIHGSVYAIDRIGGTIYAGTSLGLFRMRKGPANEPVFDPVPKIQEEVLTLVQLSGIAFVGTEHGLFALSGMKFEKVLPHTLHSAYEIAASSEDPNVFYTAGGDGVQMLKRNGTNWDAVSKVSTGQDFFAVMEAGDGKVWAANLGSIWLIDFSGASPKSEQFKAANGVPAGVIYIYNFRNHIVFASQKGLLQFDETNKRFVPDTELGERFANGQYVVSTIREDPRKDVWITGKGYHSVQQNTDLAWYESPLLEAKLGELFWLHFDPDGTCWTSGGTGALVRYQRPPALKQDNFKVLLRDTILTNDSRTIYSGDGTTQQISLPYKDNAVRFEFAAPFPEGDQAVEYAYRLGTGDTAWSAWTKETRKDYTNLFEGKYTFQVRAKSPHGAISAPASYQFTVIAPWYRTWWAYAIYLAAFLLAGWLILRWRLRALEARNRWLEGVVEQRTAEVRTERDQNEALLLNILPKPIATELRTTGAVEPASFDAVTVCFSDFVGFTLSSEKLRPNDLITSLNQYFTAFDEIIGKYGLEKLKTIGDAYMFAGGLPSASPSHAVDAVLAALDMVEVTKKLARPDKGTNWSIRLGLYSGPVVAGVVGVRKFAFDIWGNTVNFAARMESSGAANRVNLSETTYKLVADFFECESRGLVRIKEGREMQMYFAVAPKPDFSARYETAFGRPPKTLPSLEGSHAR